jgi:hypothetical protein
MTSLYKILMIIGYVGYLFIVNIVFNLVMILCRLGDLYRFYIYYN